MPTTLSDGLEISKTKAGVQSMDVCCGRQIVTIQGSILNASY